MPGDARPARSGGSTANPLLRLRELGQAVWLDYIRRDLFAGELERLIEEDGLAGMTSNPTIFDRAIAGSGLYDDAIRACGPELAPDAVFERLAISDVQTAADRFRPLYDASSGRDGYVSIEVRPSLAGDTEATIAEARRLWVACARPNVMVKIPATREGVAAIERCLDEGVNVNVTLLFSVERYAEVVDAWFAAFEARAERGEPLDRLASVASFFVSRVDTKVDARLEKRLVEARDESTRARIRALLGRIGIANARLAYRQFEARFRSPRFAALEKIGAKRQRPLWASTSTKNPSYPELYYVESLIAPDSVDTMPPRTLAAFRAGGEARIRIGEGLAEADRALRELEALGIEFAEVTRELEQEGVEKFAASYRDLLATIARAQAGGAAAPDR